MPKGSRMKDAKKVLRKVEQLLEQGVFVPSKQTPNFKQVAEDWVLQKKVNLRSSTWSVYEGHTRNHFHEINDLKINLITTTQIENYIVSRLEKE